jgi:hypothetical protein
VSIKTRVLSEKPTSFHYQLINWVEKESDLEKFLEGFSKYDERDHMVAVRGENGFCIFTDGENMTIDTMEVLDMILRRAEKTNKTAREALRLLARDIKEYEEKEIERMAEDNGN